MKKCLYLAIAALMVLAPAHAAALAGFDCVGALDQERPDSLLTTVEEKYKEIADISATFFQESFLLGLGERVISKGRVTFKKPGMMDWVYEEPEPQRFIADGKALWFHQPELNQVTIGTFKSAFSSDLPVSFLVGVGRLSQDFELEEACKTEAGLKLKLRTRAPDPNLEQFYLLVDQQSYIPAGARIVDVGGNETSIIFHNRKANTGVTESQFRFTVPKGADVIDQRVREADLPVGTKK